MYIFVSLQKDSTLLGLLLCIFYIKHRSFILNPPPKNYHVREKNLNLPEKLPTKSTSGGIFPHPKTEMIFKLEIYIGCIFLIPLLWCQFIWKRKWKYFWICYSREFWPDSFLYESADSKFHLLSRDVHNWQTPMTCEHVQWKSHGSKAWHIIYKIPQGERLNLIHLCWDAWELK